MSNDDNYNFLISNQETVMNKKSYIIPMLKVLNAYEEALMLSVSVDGETKLTVDESGDGNADNGLGKASVWDE